MIIGYLDPWGYACPCRDDKGRLLLLVVVPAPKQAMSKTGP